MEELKDEIYVGYGEDELSKIAKKEILELVNNKDSDVHFLVGGTISNKIFISHVLKPYEAVIALDSSHINVHETGTIEQGGHKILLAPNSKGKLLPQDIENIYLSHSSEHMVKPALVYITDATEYGTIYSLDELKAIREVCLKYGLYLFLDGARLGGALTAKDNDISLEDLGKLTDAFYIGGTKNGALLGEALVINNPKLNDEFRYSIKHYGGMYAKGFVAGLQFMVLFENGKDSIFFDIARKQNELADKLREKLKLLNFELYNENSTNQVFFYADFDTSSKIQKEINCEVFSKDLKNKKDILRFVTHFNNTEEDIEEVYAILSNLSK
jgi:threonine aldolase